MVEMKQIQFRVSADQAVMTIREPNGREHEFLMPHGGLVSVFSAAAEASFKAMELAGTDGTGALVAAYTVKEIEAYKTDLGSPIVAVQLTNGARLPLALTTEQADDIKAASDAMQATASRH